MQDKALQEEVKLAPAVEEEVVEKKAPEPAKEKFVGGEAPAVAGAAAEATGYGYGSKTASQLAYDGDSNKTELNTKLGALIDTKYDGDIKKAFLHYGDRHSHNPNLDKNELIDLLKDADIGNSMNRGEWATWLLEKFDTDKSGEINWRDFQKFVKVTKKPPAVADTTAKAPPAPAAAPK